MNNILIIGGRGYVGSRLCLELSGNKTSVDINWFPSCELTVDSHISDYNDMSLHYIQTFSHIVLLAGHTSVRMCDEHHASVFQNNVSNFVNLIKKMNKSQTLIYASSGSVYGDCSGQAIETNDLNKPYNMYDATKQMIDTYTTTANYEPTVIGLRFGTVNGYAPNLRNDVMLNAMTYNAWTNNKVLLFNPDTKRSILGTTDLTRAVQAIIDSGTKSSGVYNLSSFTLTSGEMSNIVAKLTNTEVNIVNPDEYNKKSINEKLVSSKYNFALNCTKFETKFSFKFEETPESIVTGLIDNKNIMIASNRNESKLYEAEQ
jgi:nucleoside-diphosphate-sugar epimerase